MPYFIYKIFPNKKLELLEDFPKYRDARETARTIRSQISDDAEYTIKVIHAKHPEEAERLLKQERKPRPLGEDA